MRISLLQWFVPRIKERLLTLLYGEVAVEAETDATLRHVANLDRLETQAQEYEAQGKHHLAELLRLRATKISPESPAGSSLATLANVASEHDTLRLPQFAEHGPEPSDGTESELPALPQPKPVRKRRGRKPKQSSNANRTS